MEILNKLFDKLQAIADASNSAGIPLPLLRDNKKGRGSVSLTAFVLSVTFLLAGVTAKSFKLIETFDSTDVLWLIGISASLYFGRKFNKDGSKVELEAGAPENQGDV